ncbi:MAG: GNAT family N-acetyltransferase [Candidatus Doudnabacteria bacterium]|nr:GNAT family N-acetyltransferase [Candidatus Doudnabacteria bacterium]
MHIKLVKPSEKYKKSFLQSFKSLYLFNYQDLDLSYKQVNLNFKEFLRTLHNQSNKKALAKGRVPSTTYWLVRDLKYLGSVNIRHYLNKHLKRVGGHIGYEITLKERGKGYGNAILKLALKKAKRLGIDKALLTCDKSNIPSKKVIEYNGGRIIKSLFKQGKAPEKLRYWIKV